MRLAFLLLLLFPCKGFSQKSKTEKLFYFITKDSLVGVKTKAGKIIIPALHYDIYDFDTTEEIKGDLIYLIPTGKDSIEPNSWGIAYNREGKFLFTPFEFDNGPDYFSEGLMRFVKNGKMGFANRIGEIIIPAKWDFVSPFNYGIASYCIGCVWQSGNEHKWVIGGKWGYINHSGEELIPTIEKASIKDQQLNRRQGVDSGKYIFYQFQYTPFEKKIVDSFSNMWVISKAFFVNYSYALDSTERILSFEIVEKPSSFFRFYHIKAFRYSNGWGYTGDDILDLNFYVAKNGKDFFYEDGEELIPLKSWLKKFVAEAKEYLKNHPEAPNRF